MDKDQTKRPLFVGAHDVPGLRLELKSPLCCHKCFKEVGLHVGFMLLCPDCGNKRCPKASDHTLECTRKNTPGQPGSIYT